jgi:predicted HTH transcriptional regulator
LSTRSNEAPQLNYNKKEKFKMASVQLTERQVQVVRAIRGLQRSLRRAPTQRQVAAVVGIARRTACSHIANLAKAGAVDKYGKVNSIKFYDLKA